MPDEMRAEGKAGEALRQRLYDEICQTIGLGSTGVRLTRRPRMRVEEPRDRVVRGSRSRHSPAFPFAVARSAVAGGDCRSGDEQRVRSAPDYCAPARRGAGFDRRRQRTPTGNLAEWIAVHRAAHCLGMRTVATLRFGAGETMEQRIDLLAAIHRLQEETGGFAAFVPWLPRLQAGVSSMQ